MALAQHHGLQTRMLDWTRRPYVAAYFAASSALQNRSDGQDNSSSEIAVWEFNIVDGDNMNTVNVVNLPGSTSANLAAQSGCFTLIRRTDIDACSTPDFEQSLEEELERINSADRLRRITVPASATTELLDYCDSLGINAATLFPGYNGAARGVVDHMCRQT